MASGAKAVLMSGGTRPIGDMAKAWLSAKLAGEVPANQVSPGIGFPAELKPTPLAVPPEVADLLVRLSNSGIRDPELAEEARRVTARLRTVDVTSCRPTVRSLGRKSHLPEVGGLGVRAEEPARADEEAQQES
jgi:hypothetical protein